jgi:hypothetical protein
MENYNVSQKDPVNIHVPKNAVLERFKFYPHVQVFKKLPGETNRSVTVKVVYEILCIFEDPKKERRRFACTTQEFVITKDNDDEIEYRGEIIFNCLQIAEKSFEDLLRKHNTLQPLRAAGMKKITFESWAKGDRNSGNNSLLN